MSENTTTISEASPKLVDATGLLETLFDDSSRPSLRWIRQMQAQRKIPYVKIGHLVRFDVEKVREALEDNCTIEARSVKKTGKSRWGSR